MRQGSVWLEHDDSSSNRHRALSYCWSMIFSENRVSTFRDHAVALLCGIASLAGVSTASAGCDCGPPVAYIAPYAVAPAYSVATPVLVAQPIPQPIYVVNQGTYPYPYV